MLMNYHELTMDEPRDSPARRKQFLVICTVMAGVALWSFITSGGLMPIQLIHDADDEDEDDRTFPGGEFIYKTSRRDYAAVNSLVEHVGKQITNADLLPRSELVDNVYTIFMDDPARMGGQRLRFAVGYLHNTPTDDQSQRIRDTLWASNADVVPPTPSQIENDDFGAYELWPKLAYESRTLPSTAAAHIEFPFTNGFVSALIFQFRILPTLRQYAIDKHGIASPVIVSTCSIPDAMCTHYVPLESVDMFFLGMPDTETWLSELGPEPVLNWDGMRRSVDGMLDFVMNPFGFLKKSSSSSSSGSTTTITTTGSPKTMTTTTTGGGEDSGSEEL